MVNTTTVLCILAYLLPTLVPDFRVFGATSYLSSFPVLEFTGTMSEKEAGFICFLTTFSQSIPGLA